MKGTPFEQPARNVVAAMGNYDNYPEPDDVAAALHALSHAAPKMRYLRNGGFGDLDVELELQARVVCGK